MEGRKKRTPRLRCVRTVALQWIHLVKVKVEVKVEVRVERVR